MSADQTSKTIKKVFEELEIGESISALEFADKIGATIYQERKKVSAFLSHQARKGSVEKHVGADGRMHYEKIAPTPEPFSVRALPSKERKKDEVSPGEIGQHGLCRKA